jgi:hypothetical protein
VMYFINKACISTITILAAAVRTSTGSASGGTPETILLTRFNFREYDLQLHYIIQTNLLNTDFKSHT